MEDDIYIVAFDDSGYIGTVTIIEKQYAAEAAKQLRHNHKKVKQITNRDEYLALLEKDATERRKNIKQMEESFS